MKRIIVQLNYDGNKKIPLNVPGDWTHKQITDACIKKYGILDYVRYTVEKLETT